MLSADGRAATDGRRTLSVTQAAGLDPAGQSIGVSGAGYDESKGVYIALCAIPPRHHLPTPCGGGVDTEGNAGASQWISSNPPSYGVGLAQPYGPGGTFETSFTVRPEISASVDCRIVACAIVTRSDHTRTSDRSQDIFVPVTFADPAAPVGVGPAPAAPPGTAPPEALPPTTTTTTTPPPVGTVSPGGDEVSDGTRTLTSSSTSDLDPTGAVVEVTGRGYDPAGGVFVALCAVGAGGVAPGPCTSGSVGASAWITSSPPAFAGDLATPYGDGGAFAVTLTVPAAIDAATDCRQVACAIATRPDDTSPLDRSQELLLPVTFAAEAPSTSTTADRPGDDESAADGVTIGDGGEGGSGRGVLPVVLAVALAAGVAAAAFVLRRQRTARPVAATEVP